VFYKTVLIFTPSSCGVLPLNRGRVALVVMK
jgi:hypothetical protein